MKKRIIFAVATLGFVGACAFVWARSEKPLTLSLQSPSAGITAGGWGNDQSWTWTFPLPDRNAGERIGLRFRQSSKPLPAGPARLYVAAENAMRSSDADREFGTGMVSWPVGAGVESARKVSIQLLDLAEIGAQSTTPGQTLRLLPKLSIGGAEVKLPNETTVLPSGHFSARTIRSEGTWNNGELFLMSFWIEGDGQWIQYDAFLEQSRDVPTR